jgi:PAS domain S-box-containing protein
MYKGTFEKSRVLVVEDSSDLRDKLVQILRSSIHAFSVEAIPSSVGLTSRLVEGDIDVLVVDYDLEVGDVSMIIKITKQIDPFLPIVLVSKDFSDHVATEAERIGADSYAPLTEISLKLLPMVLHKRIEAKALLRDATESRRQSKFKSFQLEILTSLVRKMIEAPDIKSVMQELAEQVVKKLDMKAASLQKFFKEKNSFAVYGIYPQGKLLRFVKKFYDISSEDFTFPFDPDNCIVDQYTAERKPWVGYDFADVFGTTMSPLPARMIQKFIGVESIYNAPFYRNNELLGGMVVGNARKKFTDEELDAFDAIVHISSLLFEYNESVNSQINQTEKLKAIHEISIQLHENLDPSNLFEVIYKKLEELVPSDLVRLFLFDKDKQILQVERVVVKGEERRSSIPLVMPLGKGLVGKAALERKSILENNSHLNPLSYYIGERPKLEHLLAVPVVHGSELLGVIALTRWRNERFKESDLGALEIFSSQFSIALHNSVLYERLSRSESLYRLVIEKVSDAVILVGKERKILFVNPKFLDLSGYEIEEVAGKEFDFLIYPEDRARVGEYYAGRLNGEPMPTQYEFRFVKKSGEVRVAQYNVATLFDEGKVTGFLGVARDITDMMRSEGNASM